MPSYVVEGPTPTSSAVGGEVVCPAENKVLLLGSGFGRLVKTFEKSWWCCSASIASWDSRLRFRVFGALGAGERRMLTGTVSLQGN